MTPTIALFIGRGPFAQTLKRVLIEVDPAVALASVGREEAVGALTNWAYDFAVFATPPQAHAALLPLAWARGKPCWVEKPFGTSAAAADALVAQWIAHKQPPTYVDFPHLRQLLPDPMSVDHLCCSVGGHGPIRSYMNGLWDWGAHVAAMGEAFMSGSWCAGGVAIHVERPTAWAVGSIPRGGTKTLPGSSVFSFRTGNGFNERVVQYTFTGRTGAGAHFHTAVGAGEKGLQIGMREMLEVVNTYETPHRNNWNPRFAAQVTHRLEEGFGPCDSSF